MRWGREGLTYNSTPLSCPNTGTQAHMTHSHAILTHHLQHTWPHTRIFIFILYYFVIYMNTYINTVCLWLREQSVKNHAKGEKATFLLQPLVEDLNGWNSTVTVLTNRLMLVFNCNTIVPLLAFWNLENVCPCDTIRLSNASKSRLGHLFMFQLSRQMGWLKIVKIIQIWLFQNKFNPSER